MNKQDMEALLQKYMDGETSAEEEKQMADYFRTHDTPVEWKPYRILLLQPKRTPDLDALLEEDETEAYEHLARRFKFRRLTVRLAAAAVLVLIAGSAVWWTSRPTAISVKQTVTSRALAAIAPSNKPPIMDMPKKEIAKQSKAKAKHIDSAVTPKPKSDTVGVQEPTVNCQLSTVNCQLSTVNCQLSTVNYEMDNMEARSLQRINYYRHKLDHAKPL